MCELYNNIKCIRNRKQKFYVFGINFESSEINFIGINNYGNVIFIGIKYYGNVMQAFRLDIKMHTACMN